MPGTRIPINEETTGQLRFGIAWFSVFCLVPLPLLFLKFSPEPARISIFWARFILLVFVLFWEAAIILGALLPAARELRRRRKELHAKKQGA